MAQGHLKWDQNELIDEKTGRKKSRETVPLSIVRRPSKNIFIKGPVYKLDIKFSVLYKHLPWKVRVYPIKKS